MVAALFIAYSVRVRIVRNHFAVFEMFFEKIVIQTHRNQRLRIIFWIASIPGRSSFR